MHALTSSAHLKALRSGFCVLFTGTLLGLASSVAATDLASITIANSALKGQLALEGHIEAARSSTVAAQVPGRVTSIPVDAGQSVKAGSVLARIDARELAGSDAARQAQLAQARADWERTQRLFAQKFISQSALDQSELAYKAARATASASDASLSHATITAPMSGVIGERLIEVGEMATPGRPLLTVFDPAALRVVTNLPASVAARSAEWGRDAIIELADRRITATRIEILPTVDANSQTATVRLYLPAGEKLLKPGTAVRVRLATGQDDSIAVPTAALVRRGEVTAVYVLAADGRPRLRQVRLGEPLGDGRIRIEAGLAPGEKVALDPVKAALAVTAAAAK